MSVCFWKARLEADVPVGRDLVGGDEEAPQVLGDFLEVPDGAGLGDGLHEFRGVEAPASGELFEVGVDLDQLGAFQHPAHVGDGEQGLDAAGAAGDDADGAGGGDGGDGGVAHARVAVAVAVVDV